MTLVAQDFYLHHQLFEYIPRDVQGLNLDFIRAIDRIRQSYVVGSVDGYPDELELEEVVSLALPEIQSPLVQSAVLELTALNSGIRFLFERLEIENHLLEAAKAFLAEGRYHAGNKAIIWDYAFSWYHWQLFKVDGLDAKITFLESDDLLSCDEFLIPSLVSPLLDESKVDPVALRKLLSAFGKYPSVEKKATRLLARLQA